MKNNYCVYKHTSPTNKIYIGITSRKPAYRWENGKGYRHNDYFTNAIKKYGWDNFKHEILFSDLTKEEACQKEIELIKLYKSNDKNFGYNLSSGGENPFREIKYVFTEEHRKNLSLSHIGKESCMKGKHFSEETKRKMSEARKGKYVGVESKLSIKINQYDLQSNFIKTWDSLSDIARVLKTNTSNISKCCKGKRKSTCGYVWKYAE